MFSLNLRARLPPRHLQFQVCLQEPEYQRRMRLRGILLHRILRHHTTALLRFSLPLSYSGSVMLFNLYTLLPSSLTFIFGILHPHSLARSFKISCIDTTSNTLIASNHPTLEIRDGFGTSTCRTRPPSFFASQFFSFLDPNKSPLYPCMALVL